MAAKEHQGTHSMNSRNKGKRGEREFAALLREHGFEARRGQQFAGSADSPDVVSPALPWLHIEVKRTQALNLADACAQAEGDCRGKPWVVAHRRNHAPWLITMRAEVFFEFIREFQPRSRSSASQIEGAQDVTHPGLDINPDAWAAADGGPKTEDGRRNDTPNQEFPAAADAAAGSSK